MPTAPHNLSTIRAFNRFELKYFVGADQVGGIRRELAERLTGDPYGDDGNYEVWSVYYDTADLHFYWEKIDGVKFRRKLRIRHYGPPATIADDSSVFVEIKQRVNRVTQKRRFGIDLKHARLLCDEQRMPDLEDPLERRTALEVESMTSSMDLRPTAVVGYSRLALVGRDTDAGLRVTFDTNVRGRRTDLALGSDVETASIVPPDIAIVEVKVNERVPYWLTEKIGRHNMQLVRISKYCTAIDGTGPAGLTSVEEN